MVSNTILRQKLKINSKLEMSLLKDVTDLVIHLTTWESNEIADIMHKAMTTLKLPFVTRWFVRF